MVQLCRRKIVVFDGVSGPENVQILESADFVQGFPLNFPGQRRRKAVQVIFIGRTAFGFQEELVLVFVGKGAEFVLDRRAVARTDAADRTVEQRLPVESGAEDVVNLFRSVDQKAGKLLFNRLRFG